APISGVPPIMSADSHTLAGSGMYPSAIATLTSWYFAVAARTASRSGSVAVIAGVARSPVSLVAGDRIIIAAATAATITTPSTAIVDFDIWSSRTRVDPGRVRITTQRGRSAPAEGRDRVPSGTGSRKRLGYLVSLGSGLSSIDHLGEELVHPGLHGASPVDGALRTGLRQVLHRAPGQAAPAVGPAENVGG